MDDSDDLESTLVEFRKDTFLAFFVGLVERFPTTHLPVTLLLPGGVVTGKLVSSADYFAILSQELGEAFTGIGEEASAAVSHWLHDRSRTILADAREEVTQDTYAQFLTEEHLHLKDARFVQGTVIGPAPGATMRIRLRDVSGYTFTELAPAGRPGNLP